MVDEAKPAKAEDEEEGGDEGGAGVLGAAVAVGNSRPFTALLGPAFTHLGEFLGKRTKEWVDGLEARRAKNARAHMDRVKEIEHLSDEGIEPTERQVTLLIDWVEHAQKVDPEKEDELAALWQSVLGNIYRNDAYTEEVISSVKGMSRVDAQNVLFLPKRQLISKRNIDSADASRLIERGILETFDFSLLVFPIGIAFAVFFISALTWIYAYTSLPEIVPVFEVFSQYDRIALLFVMAITGMSLCLLIGLLVSGIVQFGHYRLTAIGMRLHASGQKYLNAKRATRWGDVGSSMGSKEE